MKMEKQAQPSRGRVSSRKEEGNGRGGAATPGAILQSRSFSELSKRLNGSDAMNSVLFATIESTLDGIMAVDESGEIVACNSRFVEMWDIEEQTLASGDSNDLLLSLLGQVRDPTLFFEKVSELYWQPELESYDLVDLADGRCFERFSRPQFHEGKLAGRVWIFHDISELKKLEGQLLQTQKMEAAGTLAAGVAHDFNNIMTAVIGYTELLVAEFAPPPPYDGFLQNIHNASHRAIALVKNLFDYGRQEPVHTAKLDCNALVGNIAGLLERLIPPETVLAWTPSGTPLGILADQAQIEQVLVNLVTNARDAMPEGGTIAIAMDDRELSSHAVEGYGYAKAGRYVGISVSDTGSGIDNETLSRIFDPYFTTKEAGDGKGLGLSISYSIVKRHGGLIRVVSETGKGTTFTVLLPKVELPAQTRETEQGGGDRLSMRDSALAQCSGTFNRPVTVSTQNSCI